MEPVLAPVGLHNPPFQGGVTSDSGCERFCCARAIAAPLRACIARIAACFTAIQAWFSRCLSSLPCMRGRATQTGQETALVTENPVVLPAATIVRNIETMTAVEICEVNRVPLLRPVELQRISDVLQMPGIRSLVAGMTCLLRPGGGSLIDLADPNAPHARPWIRYEGGSLQIFLREARYGSELRTALQANGLPGLTGTEGTFNHQQFGAFTYCLAINEPREIARYLRLCQCRLEHLGDFARVLPGFPFETVRDAWTEPLPAPVGVKIKLVTTPIAYQNPLEKAGKMSSLLVPGGASERDLDTNRVLSTAEFHPEPVAEVGTTPPRPAGLTLHFVSATYARALDSALRAATFTPDIAYALPNTPGHTYNGATYRSTITLTRPRDIALYLSGPCQLSYAEVQELVRNSPLEGVILSAMHALAESPPLAAIRLREGGMGASFLLAATLSPAAQGATKVPPLTAQQRQIPIQRLVDWFQAINFTNPTAPNYIEPPAHIQQYFARLIGVATQDTSCAFIPHYSGMPAATDTEAVNLWRANQQLMLKHIIALMELANFDPVTKAMHLITIANGGAECCSIDVAVLHRCYFNLLEIVHQRGILPAHYVASHLVFPQTTPQTDRETTLFFLTELALFRKQCFDDLYRQMRLDHPGGLDPHTFGYYMSKAGVPLGISGADLADYQDAYEGTAKKAIPPDVFQQNFHHRCTPRAFVVYLSKRLGYPAPAAPAAAAPTGPTITRVTAAQRDDIIACLVSHQPANYDEQPPGTFAAELYPEYTDCSPPYIAQLLQILNIVI